LCVTVSVKRIRANPNGRRSDLQSVSAASQRAKNANKYRSPGLLMAGCAAFLGISERLGFG
jgi:hypothetical protein